MPPHQAFTEWDGLANFLPELASNCYLPNLTSWVAEISDVSHHIRLGF
jgi:hypothetical protein